MAKLEPMDILTIPSKEEQIADQTVEWMVDTKKDKSGTYHIVFQADTPKHILDIFENYYHYLYFKCDKHYTLAPKGVINKWKKQLLENEKGDK